MQPSELAKPALVGLPGVLRHVAQPRHQHPALHAGPAALAVGLVIFGVVVADLGTAVVLGAAAAVVFFVAGLRLRYCAIAATVAFLGVCVSVYLQPFRLARVVHFFDPQYRLVDKIDPKGAIKERMQKSLATRDTNYQLFMSKIAVGAGGSWASA